MGFFEGKIEIYQVLFLFVVPVGIPILMSFIKSKLLWASPVIALAIGLALTAAFYPYYFTDIFNKTVDSTTAYWLYLVLPVHFVISVIATAVCYAIKYFRTKKHNGL